MTDIDAAQMRSSITKAQGWVAAATSVAKSRDVEEVWRSDVAATEARVNLAALGPPSMALAVALRAHEAREYGAEVPWEREHECKWCGACVEMLWAMTKDALQAWAQAAHGEAERPKGGKDGAAI